MRCTLTLTLLCSSQPCYLVWFAACLPPQQAPSADELRKLRFEVAYMKDREDHLKQDLDERTQELTVIRERLVGLQEKFNNLRLENLRLDQKVRTQWFTFCFVDALHTMSD